MSKQPAYVTARTTNSTTMTSEVAMRSYQVRCSGGAACLPPDLLSGRSGSATGTGNAGLWSTASGFEPPLLP